MKGIALKYQSLLYLTIHQDFYFGNLFPSYETESLLDRFILCKKPSICLVVVLLHLWKVDLNKTPPTENCFIISMNCSCGIFYYRYYSFVLDVSYMKPTVFQVFLLVPNRSAQYTLMNIQYSKQIIGLTPDLQL